MVVMTVDAHTPPNATTVPCALLPDACRPPTFAIFQTPEGIKSPYKRYLMNRLRDAYGFEARPYAFSVDENSGRRGRL